MQKVYKANFLVIKLSTKRSGVSDLLNKKKENFLINLEEKCWATIHQMSVLQTALIQWNVAITMTHQ